MGLKSRKKNSFFWTAYADLMTSLFFIMLVLYYSSQKKVDNLERKLMVYDMVERNLQPLKDDKSLFKYDEKYKRFLLGFDVKFVVGKAGISPQTIENYNTTIVNIDQAGKKLLDIINNLYNLQENNPNQKKVSYLVIISGYASHLIHGISTEYENDILSYNRALSLKNHWNSVGFNFEQPKYKNIVDLQIAGNGWGGIGRVPGFQINNDIEEAKNQRFIIQIVPKIGDVN